MNGWQGTVLRVDLSEPRIAKELLKKELALKFIGGRGLNSKVLYDEVKPGIDPLGPDNKIVVGVGPCNGTLVPGSQRFTLTSKSPLTGFFGDSNSGGSLGAELKYAGYDMVIIEGSATSPVYLWIDDDHVELRPADHLWGKTTKEVSRQIKRELGDSEISIISIGPGGENLVKFACLIADLGRGLGRTGVGAVFGSKKLKAIVVRGTKGVKVAKPSLLVKLMRQNYEAWRTHRELYEDRVKYGPAEGWRGYLRHGMLGTRNFQRGTFEAPAFQRETLFEGLERLFLKEKACFSCPAGCDHMYIITDGPYKGTYSEGAELSQPGDFGAKVGCLDLNLAYKASTLCDELGVDIFDMSGVIAWAMECWQRGILTEKDTAGLKLEWGNADAMLELIEMTAHRTGIGNTLAQGLLKAPKIVGKGSEKYAMQVKGQAFVMREPRASKGWALAYAVSTRGACHIRAALPDGFHFGAIDKSLQPVLKEKYRDAYERLTDPKREEGKAELCKWYEDMTAFKNSMEICVFNTLPYQFPVSVPIRLAEYVYAVTGIEMTEEEVLRTGERIVNIEKAFNVREGYAREHDTLPDRQLQEPLPDGPAKGEIVRLEPMLDEYYELRGWDKNTSLPTKEKLLELELDEVADELEALGKLPY